MAHPFVIRPAMLQHNRSMADRAMSLIMIRNNTIYSPWVAEVPIVGRILWSLEFLQDAITRHGIVFPDVVFYIEARMRQGETLDDAAVSEWACVRLPPSPQQIQKSCPLLH